MSFVITVFIHLFGFNAAFNTFYKSYQDGWFIGRGNQCRVFGQDFCTVNYRPSVSLPPTFPHEIGQGPGIEPTPAGVGGHGGPLQRSLKMYK